MTWIVGLVFIASRLLFLNWGNVFFDSKEYLQRWSDPNFLNAITSGHPPLHSGYVATFWPIFQLSKNVGLDPAMVVLFFQSGLALLTVYFFYKTIKELFNTDIAFKSAVLFSALPIYWIVNEVVMMETTYFFYWVMSLFFLTRFLMNKKVEIKTILLSSFFWILAFLTHTVVIMWIPLFIYIVWTKGRGKFPIFILSGIVTLILASLINAYLLSIAHDTNIAGGLYWLYAAKFGEHATVASGIDTVLRYGRNWLMPLGYNNTWVLLVLAIVGFTLSFRKNLWLFGLSMFWIGPSFITNQWWDSLLFGRHSIISSLMIVILAVSFLSKKSFALICGLTLIISLSSLSLLKKPIPYLEVAKNLNTLPPGGLVIDSHFSRPQTDGEYFGQMLFVDEPGWDVSSLPETIDSYLKINKPVFITGHALSEPYGLFCGPYLHNLSLSYRNKVILSDLNEKYQIKEFININSDDNLNIYRITAGTSEKPLINNLKNYRRRIDWLDPLRILFNSL